MWSVLPFDHKLLYIIVVPMKVHVGCVCVHVCIILNTLVYIHFNFERKKLYILFDEKW